VIAAAYYSGIYFYDHAGEDMRQADEVIKIYGLSESDVLDCLLEAHKDISDHWNLIVEMAE